METWVDGWIWIWTDEKFKTVSDYQRFSKVISVSAVCMPVEI